MTRAYFGAALEQACIQPGHWLIEGYAVYRCRDGTETYWEIRRDGRRVQTATTLGDARDWISDRLESSRQGFYE